jgi:FixJ family two-component response regulator
LFLGTKEENNHDCDRKGRRNPPHGERNANAKLTADQVRMIRQRVIAGDTTKVIAAELHIHYTLINKIMRGESWRHVS